MKLALVIACIGLAVLLAGCKGSGSTFGWGGGSSSTSATVASLPDGGGDDGGGTGGGDTPGDDPGDIGDDITYHNPEPATVALLGGGLAGFAFLRRKRRKK